MLYHPGSSLCFAILRTLQTDAYKNNVTKIRAGERSEFLSVGRILVPKQGLSWVIFYFLHVNTWPECEPRTSYHKTSSMAPVKLCVQWPILKLSNVPSLAFKCIIDYIFAAWPTCTNMLTSCMESLRIFIFCHILLKMDIHHQNGIRKNRIN